MKKLVRYVLGISLAVSAAWAADSSEPVRQAALPDKVVVLTFDDAVSSQATFVALRGREERDGSPLACQG